MVWRIAGQALVNESKRQMGDTRLTLDNIDSQEVIAPWFSRVLFRLPISDFQLASSFRGIATNGRQSNFDEPLVEEKSVVLILTIPQAYRSTNKKTGTTVQGHPSISIMLKNAKI
jgi:hypothetical protein